MKDNKQNILRHIPGVDQVIAALKKEDYNITSGIKRIIRGVLDTLRKDIIKGYCPDLVKSFTRDSQQTTFTENDETRQIKLREERIMGIILDNVKESLEPAMRKVINATGIILHTNLGRAVLSKKAREDVYEKGAVCCNLEVDLKEGERDSRQLRIRGLLSALTGAESALVVNNNAAAVLLILDTFARGKEVIVSRGELVEIGGSFRVPEIMIKSGAKLIEVGTTNKTKLKDYEKHTNEETGIIMKVHRSNFHISGFTEEVDVKDLVGLGKKTGKIVYYDLGSSGLDSLLGEVDIESLVEMDIDLISFSGDKLLGGPQAGLILGKEELIKELNANNLHRALRIDKLSLCALETTLRQYLLGEKDDIPTYRMFKITEEELLMRTKDLLEALQEQTKTIYHYSIGRGDSLVGGGSLPEEHIPGPLLMIDGPHELITRVNKRLRQVNPAVVTSLYQGKIEINLRTVDSQEEMLLLKQLVLVLNELSLDVEN